MIQSALPIPWPLVWAALGGASSGLPRHPQITGWSLEPNLLAAYHVDVVYYVHDDDGRSWEVTATRYEDGHVWAAHPRRFDTPASRGDGC